jgi:hypothetical protein
MGCRLKVIFSAVVAVAPQLVALSVLVARDSGSICVVVAIIITSVSATLPYTCRSDREGAASTA